MDTKRRMFQYGEITKTTNVTKLRNHKMAKSQNGEYYKTAKSQNDECYKTVKLQNGEKKYNKKIGSSVIDQGSPYNKIRHRFVISSFCDFALL